MKYVFCLALIMITTACGTNDPKPPEALVKPMKIIQYIDAIEASAAISENNMSVRHHVKGNDVFVEVVVPGFKFSSAETKNKVHGEGYIKLSLNGEKIDEIHQAAFIVKGLPAGKHSLKIELVHNDATSYGVQEEMSVSIP